MTQPASTLSHLARLVAFDTRNPPRDMTANSEVFGYLRSALAGFSLQEWDHGEGSVSLLAVRGAPRSLFNYHLDTVPIAEGWPRDPFTLAIVAERATGLGACDIKGALAAMLRSAATTQADLAILITNDEEAGNSCCIREFLATQSSFDNVIVAEPTRCQAVASHRGILSGSACFEGITGHASNPAALDGSAIHRAMRWGAAVIDGVASLDGPLAGLRFNAGRIEGGVKPNMIAARASIAFNVRTLPAQDQEAVVAALRAAPGGQHISDWQMRFQAPALPDAARGETAIADSTALAKRNGIGIAPAVDFWTEAALFSAAGMNTFVLGSGDIAQAHTAGEWVRLSELAELESIYTRLINHGIQ